MSKHMTPKRIWAGVVQHLETGINIYTSFKATTEATESYHNTKQLIERLEGKKKGKPKITGGNVDWYMGYDKAIEEIINELQTTKEGG